MRRVYDSRHWRHIRQLVLRRDNHTRHWCNKPATTADHLRSISEGGAPYDPANLVASCKPCNSSRGAAVAMAKERGGF